MIRKLLIVFVSGLVLSILLLSSAWVIGGDQFMGQAKHRFGGWNFGPHGEDTGPASARRFVFDGSRVLTARMPITLRFTRGDKREMRVSGPARLVSALRWENGELSLDRQGSWREGALTVEITAPQFAGLALYGPGQVELRDLDQAALRIDAHGPIDLDASGKVATLEVRSYGPGNLELEDVEARDATVRIHGLGNIDVSATGKVDAGISGAGNITLHRKPAALTADISGLGSIDHDYGNAD